MAQAAPQYNYFYPRTSPYVQPAPSTIAPPTILTPRDRPLIGTHIAGASCGCGSKHGDTAPAPGGGSIGAPTTLLGAEFTPKLSALVTPTGFKAPVTTGGNMLTMPDFSKFDLATDWWKLLAGALVYKVLSK